jgi:hypothetical protein
MSALFLNANFNIEYVGCDSDMIPSMLLYISFHSVHSDMVTGRRQIRAEYCVVDVMIVICVI